MSNIFLAWQNRTDEGVLSGGSWTASLPITNMQNRQVQKVARTANATVAATQFMIDLQTPRLIGVLALVVHNISVSGRVKITGADSTASFTNLFTTYLNDFENAVYTRNNVSITVNAINAPDGTMTADAILGAATTESYIIRDKTGVSGTSTLTESIYLKAGSGTVAGAQLTWFSGGTTQSAVCSLDLTTGVVSGITTTGGAINASGYATDAGNGWWRLTLTATGTDAANTTARFAIICDGNAGRTFYAWGTFLASAAPLVYESPYVEAWPNGIIPQDLLEWEDDNFWFGTLTQEQRAGYQSPFILRYPEVKTARYWKVEIFDTANPAGYVQIGRLFMARGWTPNINYTYGASLGYEDPTPVDTSLSGAEYFDVRSKFRVFNFQLDYISDSDAYNYALDLQRTAGISGEVLVMPDGGQDIGQQPLRSFVGRLRQIGAITQPQPTAYSVNFEVKELL